MCDTLYMVIPAYNEEETIEQVAREWHDVLQHCVDTGAAKTSRLVVIDDGSRDHTYEKLQQLQKELPYLQPLTKSNEGHGATLLYGYTYALQQGADYVFQTDSDGQTLPGEFPPFWEQRKKYGAIIGHRKARQDGFSRVIVTKTLKAVLWMVFGLNVPDANTPFRLMQREILEKYLPQVPEKFNLSNVMLTVLFLHGKENVLFLPITFRPRQGGVNSIDLRKITKIGWKAVQDFQVIKQTMEGF